MSVSLQASNTAEAQRRHVTFSTTRAADER